MYAARVSKWGYLFVQNVLDELFPGPLERVMHIKLIAALWDDMRFWQEELGPHYLKWLGIKQHLTARKDLQVNPDKFKVQFYSDANKRFGVGGVLGPEVFSKRWEQDMSGTHIGVLELPAV